MPEHHRADSWEQTLHSLGEFVGLLGEQAATLACAPRGFGHGFTHTVIYDPLDQDPGFPGGLVLGVGLTAESATAIAAMRPAPSVLLIRASSPPSAAAVGAATDAGIALLVVSPDISWTSLAELAATVTSSDEEPAALDPTERAASELIEELFALANAVADLVGAPITIEDNESRLLAYSPLDEGADEARSATILGHRVPAAFRRELRSAGVSKRVLTETKPFYLATDLPGIKPRVVVALRAHNEVLGSMWAMTPGPFTRAQTADFSRAGSTVSLRLYQHRLAGNLRRRQHSAALTGILAGSSMSEALGASLGLTGTAFRVMTIGTADTPGPDLGPVGDSLAMQLSMAHRGALSAVGDTCIHVLVPCDVNPTASLQQCRDILHALRSPGSSARRGALLAGVGRACTSLQGIAASRAEADLTLRALQSSGANDRRAPVVAGIDEVSSQVLLLQIRDLLAAGPAGSSALPAVAAYDERHGTHYLSTLRAHLLSFGDPSLAAEELSIHTNTLRYRLKRLLELFAIDLRDADTRLTLLIELRLEGSA